MINTYSTNEKVGEIESIKFGLLSQDDILNMSVFKEDNINGLDIPESYENGEPKKGGLDDRRMGVISHNDRCDTCGEDIHTCPGHFGHIMLSYPVYHISLFKWIQDVLNSICSCGKLYLDTSDKYKNELTRILTQKKGLKRLKCFKKSSMTKNVKYCIRDGGCGKPRTKITKEVKPKLEMVESIVISEIDPEDEQTKDKVIKIALSPLDCYNRMKKITDEDCKILGFDPKYTRPEDMIISILPVPPIPVRPSVKLDNLMQEDHLTLVLAAIIKINNRLNRIFRQDPQINPQWEKYKKLRDLLQIGVINLIDNEVGGVTVAYDRSGRPYKSISKRLKHKEGRVRSNLMGKRVDFSSRSVITGDPNIGIDQLGMPLKIAMTLTFPEIVTEENIDMMKQLVKNGKDKYPGANFVIFGNKNISIKRGNLVDLRFGQDKIDLMIGDIVERHLVDDDYVLFNRQPSLHKYSMMAHKIQVIPDGKYMTFRLNVCSAGPYNADFDGDEMNAHAPQSYQTLMELKDIISIPNMIVSGGKSGPIIGIVMDALVGSYLMTDDDVKISRKEAISLLSYTSVDITKLKLDKEYYTGKEIYSYIIPKGINMEKLKDDKISFVLKDGIITDGLVSKRIIGKTGNSLNHIVWLEKGKDVSTKFINDIQRLVNNWLLYNSFTVGIGDTVISEKVKKTNLDIMEKSKTDVNKLISEIDDKLHDYDVLEINALKILGDVKEEVYKNISKELETQKDNNFIIMSDMASGSKGEILHIGQISGCLGQQAIEGGRVSKKVNGRSLAYYHYNDDSADARGFVTNSYLSGLNAQEFIFHCVAGRVGLISTAVKTQETGYIQRKLIKSLEDVMVKYDGTVRNSNDEIVQFQYADMGIEPTRLEKIRLKILKQSDDELKTEYLFTKSEMKTLKRDFSDMENKVFLNKIMKYREALRENYRKYHFRERILSDNIYMMMVNFQRVIDDKILRKGRSNKSDLKPKYVIDKIDALLKDQDVNVTCMTDAQKSDSMNIKHIAERNAKYLFEIGIFTYLAPRKVILNYKLSKEEFDDILDKIKMDFMRSIVQPGEMVGIIASQSIGEPATQLNLSSFHFTGVAGKASGATGIKRLSELLEILKKPKTPIMKIYLNEKDRENQSKAEEIKSFVETIYLKDVANIVDVLYDPKFEHLNKDGVSNIFYENRNLSTKCESDVRNMPWLIRIELNREVLMNKSITLLDIKSRFCRFWADKQTKKTKDADKTVLKKISKCAILSNYDNSEIPILHIRLDMMTFDRQDLIKFLDIVIEKFKLRGIQNVSNAFIDKANYISYDSKNKPIEGEKENYILTEGTNLTDIVNIRDIDLNRTLTNNIIETNEIFGIEAVRVLLIKELRAVIKKVNYHHVSVLVDVMCNTGTSKMTSINRHGINKLDTDPLSRASFEETTEMILKAALGNETDYIRSISSQIIVGKAFKGGTGLCDIIFDVNAIERAEDLDEDYDTSIADDIRKNILIENVINAKDTEIFTPVF
jgi:DNA-directed RNA polymerase II subunit RPB1